MSAEVQRLNAAIQENPEMLTSLLAGGVSVDRFVFQAQEAGYDLTEHEIVTYTSGHGQFVDHEHLMHVYAMHDHHDLDVSIYRTLVVSNTVGWTAAAVAAHVIGVVEIAAVAAIIGVVALV
jgi:hypothetical protein